MFKRAWMQRWTSLPPNRITEDGRPYSGPWALVQWVDSAWATGVHNDYSTISTWATDGKDYYLVDAWRGRVEYPDLKKQIRAKFSGQQWPVRAIFVEDAANGRPVIQELKREGLPVVGRKPVGSKESRADAVTPWFESGHVYLYPTVPDEWIDEHLVFPNGTHDDWVDGTSGAVGELSRANQHRLTGVDVQRAQPGQDETMSKQRRRYMEQQKTGQFTMVRPR